MFERKAGSPAAMLAAACIVLVGAQWGRAQVLYGSMVGNVNDASGAVVPGAVVEAVQQQTGLTRKTLTDSSGHYTLSTLAPGEYNLTVSAPGFKTFAKRGV